MRHNSADSSREQQSNISPDYYATLGLGLNTQQGIAYQSVKHMIDKHCNNLRTCLDYGCGAGRSTRFLRESVSKEVVGVDIDSGMLQKAEEQPVSGIKYSHIRSGEIPCTKGQFDLTFSGIVFLEVSDPAEMHRIFKELYRATSKEGTLIILVATKSGYITDSDNWKCLLSAEAKETLRNGDPVPTGTTDSNEVFMDYYWSDSFYKEAFDRAGFKLVETCTPTMPKQTFDARYIVYVCKKRKSLGLLPPSDRI